MLVAKKQETYYSREQYKRKLRSDLKQKRQSKKNKNRVSIKVKVLSSAIILLVICLSLLLRYTYIAQFRMEISQLDEQIASLNKEKKNLEIELDAIKQSEWIEIEAREKLGMDYPKSNQTVFVTVDEGMFQQKVGKIEEQEDGKNYVFLKSFKGFFNKVYEIF